MWITCESHSLCFFVAFVDFSLFSINKKLGRREKILIAVEFACTLSKGMIFAAASAITPNRVS